MISRSTDGWGTKLRAAATVVERAIEQNRPIRREKYVETFVSVVLSFGIGRACTAPTMTEVEPSSPGSPSSPREKVMRWEKVRQMKLQADLPRYEAAAKDSWTSVISAAMEARDAAERARVAREAANAPPEFAVHPPSPPKDELSLPRLVPPPKAYGPPTAVHPRFSSQVHLSLEEQVRALKAENTALVAKVAALQSAAPPAPTDVSQSENAMLRHRVAELEQLLGRATSLVVDLKNVGSTGATHGAATGATPPKPTAPSGGGPSSPRPKRVKPAAARGVGGQTPSGVLPSPNARAGLQPPPSTKLGSGSHPTVSKAVSPRKPYGIGMGRGGMGRAIAEEEKPALSKREMAKMYARSSLPPLATWHDLLTAIIGHVACPPHPPHP